MKFFFGFLAIIAAIVVVVLLTISLFRSLDEPISVGPVSSTYDLKSDQAKESVVRYTVSGPVTAEENHYEIRITISKNARTVDVIRGYNGIVTKTTTLPNTPESYNAFLGALSAAHFSDRDDSIKADPRVTCVTGNRMYFVLQEISEKKVDTWSTTCGVRGNFAGLADATAMLFRNQIPNYNEFTSGVNLTQI